MQQTDWTIIYHTADSQICPHIHRFFYEKSNPLANILYADGKEYFLPHPHSSYQVKNINLGIEIDTQTTALDFCKGDKLRSFMIHNHDKYLRDWLKDNFNKITTNNVALFEWDVLLNKQLPSIKVNGIHIKHITNTKKPWPWMNQVAKINKNISTGMAPFGVFYTNRYFIEQMIDEKYDYLYNQDLFCEARLTILSHLIQANILEDRKIFQYRAISNPKFKDNQIPTGCFHPVKEKVY
jgi:hypothetical protein